MRLSRDAMLALMALADGELEGEERARAEKLAAESEEARRVVEAMRSPALGAFLGDALEERSGAADGIADAVMARLTGADSPGETGGVVRLADARARRGPRLQIAVASGLAALAVAAAIALWFQSRDQIEQLGSPVASVGVPVMPAPSEVVEPLPTAQSATALAQEAKGPPGVEVDEIDSPSHDVHVFEIPVGEPASTAAAAAQVPKASSVVIMIEEEPGSTP
jgi:hypothetical protein